MPRFLPAILLILATPACVIVDDDNDPPADTSAVIVTDACAGIEGNVTAATVTGDALTFTVEYGGCAANEVWACWDGSFLESSPVQVPLTVRHRDAGQCDALLTTTRTVDLTPVIDAYTDAYGGADIMILRVDDVSATWEP